MRAPRSRIGSLLHLRGGQEHRHGPEAASTDGGEEITIVGDKSAPAVAAQDDSAVAAPHVQAMVAEGAAPSGGSHVSGTLAVWLFAPSRPPVQVELAAIAGREYGDDELAWVDLSNYTEGDLQEVGRVLGLQRRAISTALSPWQRPRLALYGDHFFASATVPRLDPGAFRVQASELDLFVGQHFLVSAHKLPLPFGARLLARAQRSPDLVTQDAAFLLSIVFDEVLAYYEELNEQVQSQIELMEERALRDLSDRFLEDLLHVKRYAYALFHLADQHRPVLAAFLRPDFTWVAGDEVEDYFQDLERRLERLLDLLSSAKESLTGAFDIYVSHTSHRTNQVIKVLTIVSTILFSASIVVSVFGTTIAATVHSQAVTTPVGLLVMLCCIVLVSGGTLWTFRHRGWI